MPEECIRCGTDLADRDGPHSELNENGRCAACADYVAEFGVDDE